MFATHSNAGVQASSIDNFPFVLLGGMSSPIVEGLGNAIPFRGMFFCIAAEDIWRIQSGNSGIYLWSNNQSNSACIIVRSQASRKRITLNPVK